MHRNKSERESISESYYMNECWCPLLFLYILHNEHVLAGENIMGMSKSEEDVDARHSSSMSF